MAKTSLAIVIPAKNEEHYIGKLLNSLLQQDYLTGNQMPIVVADAHSTDKTKGVIFSYQNQLDIKIVSGGLPSYGRNQGAKNSDSDFILFVDADVELKDATLLSRAMTLITDKNLDCVTTYLKCPDGNWADKLIYFLNNVAQFFSQFLRPWASGMFILFRRQVFNKFGGFDEKVTYAEDYFLTKKVALKKFGIVKGHLVVTNRRFQKTGRWTIVKMFLHTALMSWNKKYFYQDKKYFD